MRLIRLLLKCLIPCKNCLPKEIHDDEVIARCVYSTMHLKNNGDLQKSFYSPQAVEVNNEQVEGGVSTVRRNYSRLNFIKFHCLCQQNPEKRRSYHGVGFIPASEIKKCKSGIYAANVVSSPAKYDKYNLPQHADILYGYIPQKGSPLPNEINFIIENLLKSTKKEQDMFPEQKVWKGGSLRC